MDRIKCKTHIKMWSCKYADYSNLKVFGCTFYYHVNEGKLDPRAKKRVSMGYGYGVKGYYRNWSPLEEIVILSRNLVFDKHFILRRSLELIGAVDNDGFVKHGESKDDHEENILQQHEEGQEVHAEAGPLESRPTKVTHQSIAIH